MLDRHLDLLILFKEVVFKDIPVIVTVFLLLINFPLFFFVYPQSLHLGVLFGECPLRYS